MNVRSFFIAAALAAVASACGGSSGPSVSATFVGTTHGQNLAPKDAQSTTGTITVSPSLQPINAAAIVITDQPSLCSNISAAKEPKSSHYLVLLATQLSVVGGNLTTTVATQPGDYAIYSTTGTPSTANFSVAFFQTTDATCKDVVASDAVGVSGNLHITSVTNGAYAGTYDVMLAAVDANHSPVSGSAQEHVTGTFNTAACASLGGFVSLTRTDACF